MGRLWRFDEVRKEKGERKKEKGKRKKEKAVLSVEC